jgi:3-methyladenine DNA glycosylase AlkD
MTAAELIDALRAHANPVNVAGMARFGINPNGTLGVSVAEIRRLARSAGRNHALALELWASGIHEARILATIVDEPDRVTRSQMNSWARDFDSWDVCDQACQNLFWRTPHAFAMAEKWCYARPEFVRRAGFSLVAQLATKCKDLPDSAFHAPLTWIADAAPDKRNFVRKAVKWAKTEIDQRRPRSL